MGIQDLVRACIDIGGWVSTAEIAEEVGTGESSSAASQVAVRAMGNGYVVRRPEENEYGMPIFTYRATALAHIWIAQLNGNLPMEDDFWECEVCGELVAEDDEYCPNCGTEFDD